MDGSPGSMSAYTRAERNMFKGTKDGPGPADYDVKVASILPKSETIPPFDTTSVRKPVVISDGPGPIYYPIKKDLRQHGSPLFRWGERYREKVDLSCGDNTEPPPRLPDGWAKKTQDILLMKTKRPRVSFEKFVSTCIPTIYHPLDIRCFVRGIDGRVYPWRMSRNKSPGPANYNTYKVYTSRSKTTPQVNFASMSQRKSIFAPKPGAGPADYVIRKQSKITGGAFLGKSYIDSKSSAARLFDRIERQIKRDNFGGPATLNIPSNFDQCSPKAVLAPFKSKTKREFIKPNGNPGPGAYAIKKTKEFERQQKIKLGLIKRPKDKKPFDCTGERFINSELIEIRGRPSPSTYNIPSFTDKLKLALKRYQPALRNPKLGFLSSAEARPPPKTKGDINIASQLSCHCLCDKPRQWRNLRPRPGVTYRFNGPPPKFPDSPGPIYDTAPACAAIKAKKSWLDPRNFTQTAFLNSGCNISRQSFLNVDKDIPGPANYFAKLPLYERYRGRPSSLGPRFLEAKAEGPGPTHKLHEKCDSAMWRASHLGTHNSYLKHVGILFPWAGGFRKKNLTAAGDAAWHIVREDEYKGRLCTDSLDTITNKEDVNNGKGDFKLPQPKRSRSAPPPCTEKADDR